MSALEEYRILASEVEKNGGGWYIDVDVADAAIAELQAELAALKARRCETCGLWRPKREKGFRGCKGLELYATPHDFSCSRWQEREEA